MSGSLAPDAVLGLGPPWTSTPCNWTRGTCDPAALPAVLERVLAGLETTPEPDPADVPADLMIGWSFTAQWLAEAMPALADITPEAVRARVSELPNTPSEAAEGIGRFWVAWLMERLLYQVLDAVRSPDLDAVAADRLMSIVESRVGAVRPLIAKQVLCAVATGLGAAAGPLLDRLAAAENLDPAVREEAALNRNWVRGG